MSFFKALNIVKTYANHKALDDVSINIPEGSIYGLLGPNGAGKTSLIRSINQITAPDSGEIFFRNEHLKPTDVSRSVKRHQQERSHHPAENVVRKIRHRGMVGQKG